MPFQKGQSGNPLGAKRDKPFREALKIEAALAEDGQPSPAPKGSIRYAARQLLERAAQDTASFREAADRLDGKVPQAIIGDEDEAPIQTVTRIEIVAPSIVQKDDDNSEN